MSFTIPTFQCSTVFYTTVIFWGGGGEFSCSPSTMYQKCLQQFNMSRYTHFWIVYIYTTLYRGPEKTVSGSTVYWILFQENLKILWDKYLFPSQKLTPVSCMLPQLRGDHLVLWVSQQWYLWLQLIINHSMKPQELEFCEDREFVSFIIMVLESGIEVTVYINGLINLKCWWGRWPLDLSLLSSI